jgi:PAS domain S-box-containing protein
MDAKELKSLTKEELINKLMECHEKSENQTRMLDLGIYYKYLAESASDVIFILDISGNFLFMNEAGERLSKHPRDKAIGMHYTEYIAEIELDRAKHVFDAVLKDGKVFHNEKIKTYDRDGNTIYLLANFSPIRFEGGNIIGLLAILRDITEMHLMEKKLKENTRSLEERMKEKLQQTEEMKRLKTLNDEIIDKAPIGIFTMDPNGTMLSDNPALKEIMGHKPDETKIGVNFSEYSGFVESGLQGLLDEAVLRKQPVKQNNITYIPLSRDRKLNLNVRMNPLFDNKMNVKSVLVMVEDITEQMKITSKMQRAEKLSAMGLLANGVALELKVPLNLMTLDLNFIDKNINENSPMADYVKSLKGELERIKKITDQLLNLSKPVEEAKEVFEIHKVITSHPIQATLNRLQKNGYKVTTSYTEESPRIKAMHNQLVQVLLHLISNAEDAMPDKGEIRISVDSETSNGITFASITVEDTGIGIPEENLRNIFQPFFSTKGKKSSGLGLMVTYSIVENHGGTIGIKSAPGEGTSVRILIPVVEE